MSQGLEKLRHTSVISVYSFCFKNMDLWIRYQSTIRTEINVRSGINVLAGKFLKKIKVRSGIIILVGFFALLYIIFGLKAVLEPSNKAFSSSKMSMLSL